MPDRQRRTLHRLQSCASRRPRETSTARQIQKSVSSCCRCRRRRSLFAIVWFGQRDKVFLNKSIATGRRRHATSNRVTECLNAANRSHNALYRGTSVAHSKAVLILALWLFHRRHYRTNHHSNKTNGIVRLDWINLSSIG